MIIELTRAHTPEDIGREEACEICARPFRTEAVLAMPWTEGGTDMGGGLACPACVEALGKYRPDKFPTLEEYEAAKLRFPGPIWQDVEEAADAEQRGAHYHEVLAANRIERASGTPSAE